MTAIDGLTVGLRPGTEVEVLTRYEPRWSAGFVIAAVERDRFLLRRRSDGSVLPASFGAGEIRPRRSL